MARGDKSVTKILGPKATDKVVKKPLMPASREGLPDHRRAAFRSQMNAMEQADNSFKKGLRTSYGLSRDNAPDRVRMQRNQKSSGKEL